MTIKPLVYGYFKRYEKLDFTDEYVEGLAERMEFFIQISNFPFHDTFNFSPKRVSNRASEVYYFLYLVTEYSLRHWEKKLDAKKIDKELGGKTPKRKIHELITNAEKVLSDIENYKTYTPRERAELEFELKLYITKIKEKSKKIFNQKQSSYPKSKNVIDEDRDNYRYIGNYLAFIITEYQLDVSERTKNELINYISFKA